MACPQFLKGSTAPTLADDRPVNEYFFVRRLLAWRWSWLHVAGALL
jgi:hypothetical protein